MSTEEKLITRYVFIDTCCFKSKYFRFGVDSLGRTQSYVEDGKIYLIMPDITKSEIKKKIKEDSFTAIQSFNKFLNSNEIKLLEISKRLPSKKTIQLPTVEDLSKAILDKFDELLDSTNVKTISIENINPKIVFDRYFTSKPPFQNEKKKHEFPDAFVLEALSEFSKSNHCNIYVISSDPDMISYCEGHPKLFPLKDINKLNSLIITNDKDLEEPYKFAEQVFNYHEEKIINIAKAKLYESDFEVQNSEEYFYENIINDIEIKSILIKDKDIQSLSMSNALFQVSFEVNLEVNFSLPNYEASPWDPEDKVYIKTYYERFNKNFTETFSAELDITYEDHIINNSEIENFEFENLSLEL